MQLDLFQGVVLNAKQQTQLEEFVNDQAIRSQSAKIKNEQTEIALIDAGFVKGVDFKNNFEIYNVVEDVELGYSYDNSNFQVNDVSYIGKRGGISLLSKRYSREEDKIVDIEMGAKIKHIDNVIKTQFNKSRNRNFNFKINKFCEYKDLKDLIENIIPKIGK